jgi:release factor glutamine methyltransferase
LEVAQANAAAQNLTIDFRQADMLAGLRADWPTLDFIVSNPPYVREQEAGAMHPNVLDHEPHLALFVPDADPLRFYRAIGKFAHQQLKPGGHLYLEINEQMGTQTAALLTSLGFQNPVLRQDIFGKDRMLRVEK